jgi:hypothetical protein
VTAKPPTASADVLLRAREPQWRDWRVMGSRAQGVVGAQRSESSSDVPTNAINEAINVPERAINKAIDVPESATVMRADLPKRAQTCPNLPSDR